MDAVESVLHGILDKVNGWFYRPTAAAEDASSSRMSREFWMPDQSCRVCYECESQFTVFNRRHHCRLCGKVFCGKCTINTISATPSEGGDEGERIRVCNFCYKLRQQLQLETSSPDSLATPTLTPTSSRSSLLSSNTSGTSMASPTAGSSSKQPDELYTDSSKVHAELPNVRTEVSSSFYSTRSDDEEENNYAAHTSESLPHNRSYQCNGVSEKLTYSSSRRSCDDMEGLYEEANFHGQLYEAASREVEQPGDFEDNELVWIPPLPEDDEEDAGPSYDDDDDDDDGGWGLPRSSGSFSSSDFRNRERAASEEHRKAMRSVVDGHFRALVAELLKGENIADEDEDDKDSWLEIVTFLALQAASIVKPDSSRGGSMDPGAYVKVKCIASGRRSDSKIIKGIVCKKNMAHKRMATKFKNPRLLLLGGALEYQRVANHLTSVDTLLQQEKDYLNMAAARIEAHHPNVVLVEQGVARFAQDRLLAKDISLVLKVKRPLLERIARCTGAQLVLSPDHLSNPKTGHCEYFYMEKFVEEHGSAGQGGKALTKTLMFFEGCPKPLGCTAVLRGANGDDLKKIKRVLQLSFYAAYHLALETSFLADEGATLPDHRSPIVVTLPTKQSISDSITSIPGFTVTTGAPAETQTGAKAEFTIEPSNNNAGVFNNASGFTGDLQSALQRISGLSASFGSAFAGVVDSQRREKDALQGDKLMVELQDASVDQGAETEEDHGKDDFPPTPSDHQSILVSLLTRCVTKGTICEFPNIVRIKYYGSSDKPLGRFLRDELFDLSNRCQHCEEPPDVHIRCYTHRLGTLTITVLRQKPENSLSGDKEGKIWMWHRCLKCPRVDGIPPVTKRKVMSDAAWGLSFGKFLELSFSNHAAVSRVASCGHSLHRDCLRFYGFGNMTACFRYAAVHLHAVHLPPPKLAFNDPDQQEWLRKEAEEVGLKGELVFAEILDALRVIGEHIASSGSFAGTGKIAEVRRRVVYFENLFQTEKAHFEEALLKARPLHTSPGQAVADVIELNRLRRDLFLRALEWDKRLHFFAASQQRKFTSDSALLNEQAKEKSPILKTFSNSDVGGIVQSFLRDNGTDLDKSSSAIPPASPQTESSPDCNLPPDGTPCPPAVTAAETESLQQNPGGPETHSSTEVRRALSEGNYPTDISMTLDAAWIGESSAAETPAPVNIPDDESSTSKKESDRPPVSDNEADSEKATKPPLTPKQSMHAELQAHHGTDDREGIGNWIGGPYSTLYRNNRGPISPSSAESISRAAKVALEGTARLLFPAGVNDVVIPVYEDEPTSIIANSLVSHLYATEVCNEKDKKKERENGELSAPEDNSVRQSQSEGSLDAMASNNKDVTKASEDDAILNSKGLNLKIENAEIGPEAKLKYTVVAYYAKHFDAVRKKCCDGDLEFVRSLSRCKKWGAQGGKSNVFFAKTMDDRFIIKQVTRTELLSFLDFAPHYFRYLCDSLNTGSPTCLAKILGLYQVVIKQLKGGKEVKMELMVMENLLYGRHPTRLYDLKGSLRSRYNSDTAKSTVLLDQNLLETMPKAPIFVGNKAKRLLERAVWNDTSFLANVAVMDYSLLVGIDEESGELVLGIIDFMRQYTWDKHLETWVKLSGILGGPKDAQPTVISPKHYKKRFRKAMSTYFVTVPDQWTPPSVISAPERGSGAPAAAAALAALEDESCEPQHQQQQQQQLHR